MEILKSNKNYTIKTCIDNKVDEINIPSDATITELGKLIYDKYLLSNFNYSIIYRNKKLMLKDVKKVSYYFDKEPNPFVFIINNKLLSPECKESFNIRLLMPQKYRIRFTKPVLANEFIQFYNIINEKRLKNRINLGLNLPTIKFKKSTSSEYVLENGRRDKVLNNVIRRNIQDSLITERSVKTGMDLLHPSFFKSQKNKNKKYRIKLIKNNYKGEFKLPFLNPDERYYREQYLDKKNWISKSGFHPCIGNYKMGGSGCNYISNYVSATPSESPLNHNFREVNKTKWLNKKGFYM